MHSRTVFEGDLIRVEVADVQLEDGTPARREIVRHPGAVAVVARLPDGRFVFVRQFRKPVEAHLIEVIAGTLDPGEAEETCARREVAEESGCAVRSLRRLGKIFPSPGYVDEGITVFFAEVSEDGPAAEGDHDERIENVFLTRAAFEEDIRGDRAWDAKTLAAWMLYLQSEEQ